MDPTTLEIRVGLIMLLFSFLLIFLLYVIPILIVRFSIVKHPFVKTKSKIISICYGIILYILLCSTSVFFPIFDGINTAMDNYGVTNFGNMYTYLFISIIICGFINYKILKKHTKGEIVPFVKNQKYFFSIFSDTITIQNSKAFYLKSKEKDKHSKYFYIYIYIEGEISPEYYGKNIGFNINILDCNNDPIAGSAWKDNKNYIAMIEKDGSFKIKTTLVLEETLKNSICYAEFKNPQIQ